MSLCVDIFGVGICQMSPPFPMFIISIQQGQFLPWSVYRSYNQFKTLYEQIRNALDIPVLPVLVINNTLDLHFLEQSKFVLNEWLQVVCDNTEVLRSQLMYRFLCADANIVPPNIVIHFDWKFDGKFDADGIQWSKECKLWDMEMMDMFGICGMPW